jgi:hypothetical protein
MVYVQMLYAANKLTKLAIALKDLSVESTVLFWVDAARGLF